MATWDIKTTHSLIQERFGASQWGLARPSIQSLVDRQRYARYHYDEINALFADFRAKHLVEASSILALTEVGDLELDQFIMKSGAHGIACLQCLHSMTDILAHVIYFSLGMNLGAAPLREREIGVAAVIAKLRTVPAHEPIHKKVSGFVESDSYKHLAAAANVSKHRSIVGSSIHEDCTNTSAEAHSVKFVSFRYSGKIYPSLTVRSALKPVYNDSSVLIVDVGNAISSVLLAGAP